MSFKIICVFPKRNKKKKPTHEECVHSHAHILIFVKLFTVILVWRQGRKVREVFQLQFWEQVYSLVTGCPKSAPSKQRYICRKQHEMIAYYSMKLLPYILSFRCVSATVGLSL